MVPGTNKTLLDLQPDRTTDMKKRYRQTMTITIDVFAENEQQATEQAGDAYFDFNHFWNPQNTIIVSQDAKFNPINEPDD